jgi:ethylmalonyl-CoA mutase
MGDVMESEPAQRTKDRPWMMRTYAGHSSARESNQLYRLNLSKGQTGLSVAFDLPTQAGYDPDHPRARGEVGKVGVSVAHLGDMQRLFEGISLSRMNTSMTINAPAAWMLALYIAAAEDQGTPPAALRGTTQNDIVKEYLSRGLYVYPPGPSMRLIVDMIAYTVRHVPSWNPINICSYHLQEAGATPVQELAFALANAIGVLDAVRDSGQLPPEALPEVVGRISFFVNAGIRFVEETAKMRAFVRLWDEITRDRYGVEDPKLRRFRYGVQVNSLGLTEAQPENNIQRIVLQTLGVLLSRDARARAVQLPAWNEALGLPRPWDQQWSLRIQQVLAHETDLLEYPDLFEGSRVMEDKVGELASAARAELDYVLAMGGVVAAVEGGYLKRALVASHAARLRAIEQKDQIVVGVNDFVTTESSALVDGHAEVVQTIDPAVEAELAAEVTTHRAGRDDAEVKAALADLTRVARSDENIMPTSIRCAHAGVTTGEWSDALRRAFGEYRAPTGLDIAPPRAGHAARTEEVRARVKQTNKELQRHLRLLVAKPGLEGHANGAEQIALKAREVGMEVIYGGLRQTPEEIVFTARDEDVDLIGLSMLSGSHVSLTREVVTLLDQHDMRDVPIVAGGIIPKHDEPVLKGLGVAQTFTPRNADLNAIMAALIDIVRENQGAARLGELLG